MIQTKVKDFSCQWRTELKLRSFFGKLKIYSFTKFCQSEMVVVRKGWGDLTVVVAVAAAVVASDHQRTPGKPEPGRGVEGGRRPTGFVHRCAATGRLL